MAEWSVALAVGAASGRPAGSSAAFRRYVPVAIALSAFVHVGIVVALVTLRPQRALAPAPTEIAVALVTGLPKTMVPAVPVEQVLPPDPMSAASPPPVLGSTPPGATGVGGPDAGVPEPAAAVPEPLATAPEPLAATAPFAVRPVGQPPAEVTPGSYAPVLGSSAPGSSAPVPTPPVPSASAAQPRRVIATPHPPMTRMPPATVSAGSARSNNPPSVGGAPSPAPATSQPAQERGAATRPTSTATPTIPPRPVAGMETNSPPAYPMLAQRRRDEGVVMLRVDVAIDGQPSAVAILRSSGHELLDEAAAVAVRRWRFVPATSNGLAVAASADVPIAFKMPR